MNEKDLNLLREAMCRVESMKSLLEEQPNKTVYMYRLCQGINDKLGVVLKNNLNDSIDKKNENE